MREMREIYGNVSIKYMIQCSIQEYIGVRIVRGRGGRVLKGRPLIVGVGWNFVSQVARNCVKRIQGNFKKFGGTLEALGETQPIISVSPSYYAVSWQSCPLEQ
jgi:hypothetical protein